MFLTVFPYFLYFPEEVLLEFYWVSISIPILTGGLYNLTDKTHLSFPIALLPSFGVYPLRLTTAPCETHSREYTNRRQLIEIN